MALNTQKFSESTELFYEKKDSVFWGDYNGFPICLHYNSQRSYFTFALCAAVPDAEAFAQALKEWERSIQGISQSVYERNMLRCIITIPGMQSNEKAKISLDSITTFARHNGLIPCCATCGDTTYYAPHMVNENLVMQLCDSCAGRIENSFEETRTQEDAAKPNWGGILLGILIGAAALFGLTYLLHQLGRLHFISGYIGVVISLFCMKKLGKKITVPAALLAVVACLAVAYITPCFAMAQDLSKFVREDFTPDMQSKGYTITALNEYIMLVDEGLATMSDSEIQENFGGTRAELQESRTALNEALVLMKDYPTTKACFLNIWELSSLRIMETDDSSVKNELIKSILWGVLSVAVGALLTIPGVFRSNKTRYKIRRLA